ncbi:MAG TPA: hydroxyacid dehydrogenase [Candidatus Binataceae bacterium]|nr:hydroxyacid dehydrogenase [Candidatus Binataceae bacterium]
MAAKHVFYVKYLADPVYAEILARRPEIALEKLENGSDEASVDAVLSRAHVYQITSSRDEVDARFHGHNELLKRAPRLLAISTTGVGYDTVDLAACTEAGVIVVNQAGGNREAVAEHVLGMMLCLSKRIIEADRVMRRQAGVSRADFMGHDLHGKTVGIIGIGNVGSRLAQLCTGLFAMRVLAYDPYLSHAEISARGAEKVELKELLRRADFVSINCPLTPETRGMIGAEQFALMPPHAYFIATARGAIYDEAALAQALSAGRLAGAGLDVWATEPPPPDHPLLRLDNVLASPHTAGITHEARHYMATIAAEQVLDILDGKRPPRLLNPLAWPAYAQRFTATFGFAPDRAQE